MHVKVTSPRLVTSATRYYRYIVGPCRVSLIPRYKVFFYTILYFKFAIDVKF